MALAAVQSGYRTCGRLPRLTLTAFQSSSMRRPLSNNHGYAGKPSCGVSCPKANIFLMFEDACLSGRLRQLSLSPAELNLTLEYELPTTCIHSSIKKGTIFYETPRSVFECPTRLGFVSVNVPGNVASITDPENNKEILEPTIQPVVGKLAKNVLKIRRRKMNRHHLKKLRKRMKFLYRKRLHRKRKAKEAKVQAEFRDIMKRSEDFDPAKFVQENLEQARKGGFSVDIFESQRQRN